MFQDLLPQLLDQALVQGDDVVLGDEAHLQVHLGELGLTVGAQVLVAEAAGDLEVAVKAGQHQDLLVQLRRLGQGVEVARLHTAGYQIVAGAFRGALDQHGGLDLAEVVVAVVVADDLADLAAQHDGVVHAGAAQVQIAVLQAQLVLHLHLVADLEGGGLGSAQQAHLGHIQLHVAGGDFIGLGVALAERPWR